MNWIVISGGRPMDNDQTPRKPIDRICDNYAEMRLLPGDYDTLIDDAFSFHSKKLFERTKRRYWESMQGPNPHPPEERRAA
jgi:hypothetical protein